MAFLELCIYVTEHIKKYILLLTSIQDALQKRKFQPAVNSAHVQRIPATRLISQHSESDFVKLVCGWRLVRLATWVAQSPYATSCRARNSLAAAGLGGL